MGLVNSSGSIATSYTYTPFGKITVSGSSNGNPFQFTGRENDGTGLYYYRARYYSPTYQRFIAQDPLDFRGGSADLYVFVGDNPVSLKDPLGLSLIACLWEGTAIGAGFGFGVGALALVNLLDQNPELLADAPEIAAVLLGGGTLVGAAGGAILGAISCPPDPGDPAPQTPKAPQTPQTPRTPQTPQNPQACGGGNGGTG